MYAKAIRERALGVPEDIPYDFWEWERWVASLRPRSEVGLGFARIRRMEGGPEYSYVMLPDGTLWKSSGGSWTSSR